MGTLQFTAGRGTPAFYGIVWLQSYEAIDGRVPTLTKVSGGHRVKQIGKFIYGCNCLRAQFYTRVFLPRYII